MSNKIALVPDPEPAAPKPAYKPTQAEIEAVEAHSRRRKAARPAPNLKVTFEDDKALIDFDHPQPRTGAKLLFEAIGTADGSFFYPFISQLANLTLKDGRPDEDTLNFALAIVRGIEPNDQIEAMLAAQIAAVHLATLTFAGRLGRVETLAQQDSAERAFNKLARTFAMLMDALKRYRSTGEQKITVQHQNVTVNDGGQAIVGDVTTGGGQKSDR